MEKIVSFKYSSNAIYVINELHKKGITAEINEQVNSKKKLFEIMVSNDNALKAKAYIDKMEIDDSYVDSSSEGYIEGMSEWSEHMYDPGHYTGGKTPHYLFDKSNWKLFAPLYLVSGAILFYLIFSTEFELNDLETILYSALSVVVGISMYWQLSKRKRR